ncbi:MAG: hypothetical protein QGF59_00070, partial [Pirellulaceae bacterium]|nr:hypothetical protein [Pirellulaceae bacterium]
MSRLILSLPGESMRANFTFNSLASCLVLIGMGATRGCGSSPGPSIEDGNAATRSAQSTEDANASESPSEPAAETVAFVQGAATESLQRFYDPDFRPVKNANNSSGDAAAAADPSTGEDASFGIPSSPSTSTEPSEAGTPDIGIDPSTGSTPSAETIESPSPEETLVDDPSVSTDAAQTDPLGVDPILGGVDGASPTATGDAPQTRTDGDVKLRLATAIALPQTLVDGTQLGVSVDYFLIGGPERTGAKYFWVISRGDG